MTRLTAFILGALLSGAVLADQTHPWIVPTGSTSQILSGIYTPNITDGTTFDASMTQAATNLEVKLWDGTNLVAFTGSAIEPLIVCIQDDGGTPTDDSTDCQDNGADDFAFPATPASGDDLWFGVPFTSITKLAINVTTAGTGTYTITWNYWDGDSVEPLAGVTDGTSSFKTLGLNTVTFTNPGTCGAATLDLVQADCWIVATIDAGTTTIDPLIGEVFACGFYGAPSANSVIWGRCEDGGYQLIVEDAHYSGAAPQYVSISADAVMDWAGQIFLNAIDQTQFETFVFNGVVEATDGDGGGDQDLATAADVAAVGTAVTSLPTAAANADAVWEENLDDHDAVAGSGAEALFGNVPQTGNAFAALEQARARDALDYNCEVSNAVDTPTPTLIPCIVTDRDDMAVTTASGDLDGKRIRFLGGDQVAEERFIQSTVLDTGELQLTIAPALPGAPADGDIAQIY